jgi:hypothetical protein
MMEEMGFEIKKCTVCYDLTSITLISLFVFVGKSYKYVEYVDVIYITLAIQLGVVILDALKTQANNHIIT